MNCLRCNSTNVDEAKFCTNCGMDLTYLPPSDDKSSKVDVVIFIFLVLTFFSELIVLIEMITNDYYGYYRSLNLNSLIGLMSNIMLFVLAFFIKNKLLKVMGVIIVVLILVGFLFSILRELYFINY